MSQLQRSTTELSAAAHVRRPGFFTRQILNRIVAASTRLGVPVYGSRVLAVRGRVTGEWRHTPVNPLTLDGASYLVAPRGHVQWTKNLRATGEAELKAGRRTERFTATEVADADKPAILRAYLARWAFEVGVFFEGVGADSDDAALAAIAPRHPVFRLTPAE